MGKKLAVVGAVVALAVIVAVLMARRHAEKSSVARPQRIAAQELGVVERPPRTGAATGSHAATHAPPESDRKRAQELESRKAELRSKVSETVAVAAALTQEKRYFQRLNAIRSLGKKLSPAEKDALYLFLDSRFAEQKDLSVLTFNALKNDILNALEAQESVPEDLGLQLVRMYRDSGQDDVWRDYCIQHLGLFYEARWPKGAPLDDKQRKEIDAAYWEAVADTTKPTAGTALIGMKRLAAMAPLSGESGAKDAAGARRYPEFDMDRIAEAALRVAGDTGACEGARTTAMAMCGEIGRPEALPAMRVAAQTGESVMFRMASIAALGTCGESSDMELLQALAQEKETRIRAAAESAAKRLRTRLDDKGLAAKAEA